KLRLERASVSGRCSGTQGNYEARRGLYRRWSRTEFYVRVGIAVEARVRHRHPAAELAGTAHVQSALRDVSQPCRLREQPVLARATCGTRPENDTGRAVCRH